MSPYRHPADREGYTARPWRVTEWQKVYVLLMRRLTFTRIHARWRDAYERRWRNRYGHLAELFGPPAVRRWVGAPRVVGSSAVREVRLEALARYAEEAARRSRADAERIARKAVLDVEELVAEIDRKKRSAP